MKRLTFISTLVLLMPFVNVQAGNSYNCLEFNGEIPAPLPFGFPGDPGLYPNPEACDTVRDAEDKYFPGITLLIDSYPNLPSPIPPFIPLPLPFPQDIPFPLCFTGNFTARLGDTDVIVTTNSALTENYLQPYLDQFDPFLPDLTAATVLTINLPSRNNGNPGRELGTIYFQDTFLSPPDPFFTNATFHYDTREYLTAVDGKGQYNQARGRIVIEGDAASGAPVTGKLCFKSN